MSELPDEDPKAGGTLSGQIRDLVSNPPRLRSLALSGLFGLAMLAVIHIARPVLVPLTFALLFSFLLRPVVRALGRLYVPHPVGALLVVGCIVGSVGFGVVRMAEPAAEWMERLPKGLRDVEQKLRPFRRPVEKATEVAQRVEKMASVDERPRSTVAVREPTLLATAFDRLGSFTTGTIVMLIVLYFMLISGESLMNKMILWLPDLNDQKRASKVLERVEHRMSVYLATIVLINVTLGCAIGVAVYLLGMPNAMLWGAVACLLNFIPYLGAVVGTLVISLAALISFDTVGPALAVSGVYLALTSLEGSLVTPFIVGRAFRLSPLVIVLWLVFWGWMWGLAGGILAVPILTLVHIVCEQSETLRPIADLLRR